MLHQVKIFMNNVIMGTLSHDTSLNQFSFMYDPEWINAEDRFPLSPQIPFVRPNAESNEVHSALVRQFFENLLPEGKALDDASIVHQVSKSNIMAMLMAVGKETSGALSIGNNTQENVLRPLPISEMSERINARPHQPFSVWDGKVRLSIAGYQDKIAALKMEDQWYLPEGSQYASTHIIKPEPTTSVLHGMTSNEFFCMRLAKHIQISVAEVALIKVPEPVLVITRFDRVMRENHVDRLHFIDGCQALGLSVGHKYERPFGSGVDVAHIRDGASYALLFNFVEKHSATPSEQKLQLLKWIIYQVLIGNIDAHAKNISFKSDPSGFKIAPAYDLVSGLSFTEENLDKSYAMAIGDAFSASDLSPYEWANFALNCHLTTSLVSKTIRKLAESILNTIDSVHDEVVLEGADNSHISHMVNIIKIECNRQLEMSYEIKKVKDNLFS